MSKDQLKNKINYFRSCYAADNRSLQLFSFFSKKVSHPYLLDDADLLSGQLPYLPVGDEWGEKALKTLNLYSKEKGLYLCAFYILGNTIILNRKQRLIAPLLLYPAELKQDGKMYKVELTSFNPILNPSAIQPLSQRDPSVSVLDELSNNLPTSSVRFGESVFLKNALDALFSNLNTDTLSKYPDIVPSAELEKLRRSRTFFNIEDQFHLISSMGLGVLSKTKSGRGILNELAELTEKDQNLSDPLQEILGLRRPKPNADDKSNVFVPVTLNKAQDVLIRGSHRNNISIAVGPPGTGKSFTIAALTVDAISRGESVLIASNNQQAVEVIAQMLEKDFKLEHQPIKTTDKRWKAQAKQFLENILAGIGVEIVYYSKLISTERELIYDVRKINRLEKKIKIRTKNEKKWGRYLHLERLSFLERIRLNIYLRRAKKTLPLWVLYEDLLEDVYFKNELLKYYLSISRQYYLLKVLSEKRKELQIFLKALRARTGNLKEERFNKINFQALFDALPIWLVTMEEINQVLPLRKELFDLVIFDEATQCNIASALPVIQRAKRLVVVGDPKQLRHISFLSKARQLQFLERHHLSLEESEELDYRNKSLLDFALDGMEVQENIYFLNEHYRSLPDLIAFSNKKFYNKALNIMTDTPTAQTEGNLHLHHIKGKQLTKGNNKIEGTFILNQIKEVIKKDAGLKPQFCRTIGILSPFREHTDYLSQEIGKAIPLEAFQRHQILIGTPHFFQGEERDIMFLSFALDDDSHPSAFQYLEKPDVFNVSITRARTEQHILISFEPKNLRQGSLLKQYIASIANGERKGKKSKEWQFHDEFLQEVAEVVRSLSVTDVHLNYHISGLDIDMVIVKGHQTYCIDLVGYPGDYGAAFPLERIKMLDRMKIHVFSLPYLLWRVDREMCIEALKEFLNGKRKAFIH